MQKQQRSNTHRTHASMPRQQQESDCDHPSPRGEDQRPSSLTITERGRCDYENQALGVCAITRRIVQKVCLHHTLPSKLTDEHVCGLPARTIDFSGARPPKPLIPRPPFAESTLPLARLLASPRSGRDPARALIGLLIRVRVDVVYPVHCFRLFVCHFCWLPACWCTAFSCLFVFSAALQGL